MNRILKSSIVVLVGFASLSASAADSKQRAALAHEAGRNALNKREVEVLRRGAGPGNGPAADAMLSALDAAGHATGAAKAKRVQAGDRVLSQGSGWALEAQGEGTRVRFHKLGFQGRGVPADQKPGLEQLQDRGEAFVKKELASVVSLGAGETLVPFKTRYLKQGMQAQGGKSTESVTAATVVFTRAIDGVPVLGEGSKAAVTFDMDGKVIGFDVDWAKLQRTGTRQVTVGSAEVGRRHGQLQALNGQSPNATLRRMECGYYDAGYLASRAGTLVQPACVYDEVEEKAGLGAGQGKFRSAKITAVPLGASFEADEALPEALQLKSAK